MNTNQKYLLLAAHDKGYLAAPSYTLTIDEVNAYCGLHNIRAIRLNADYSFSMTEEGYRILSLGEEVSE